MKKSLKYLVIGSICSMPIVSHGAIETNAQKVLLQTSCTVNGSALDNCFEDMDTMHNWIFNTRVRSKTNPLLVEIGPGLFYTSQFSCQDDGYITLKGSGRQHTTIKSNGAYTMTLSPYCSLDVIDLRIEDRAGSSLGAININNTGSGTTAGKTTWSNVDVDSKAYGWTESACSDSTHYWFGSTINVRTGFNIARGYSTCSTSWFYGSEITATATGGGEAIAIIGKGGGNETHFYGGNLRVLAGDGVNMQDAAKGSSPGIVKGLTAVSAGPGDEIHIHGTGIDVISAESNNTAALLGWDGSFIHASESSYALKTGAGGTITRILPYGNADIRAPHDWHQSTTAPNIVSVTGADNFVDIGGTYPDMFIYNSNCTLSGGPWSNLTGQCRQ